MQRLAAGISLLALVVSACTPGATQAPDGKLPVVATFSILGDLVQNVGGEHVAVSVLAGPGVDTHTFEPTAADAAALANSRLVFENGLEFETWLDDLYAAAGAQATRIVVSDGIDPIEAMEMDDQAEEVGEAHHPEEEGGHEEGEEHAEDEHEEGEHAHGEHDPHAWHSVANAMIMTRNIRDALIAADPAHTDTYQANADNYTAQLQELDDWIAVQVNTLPLERRKLVTTHDTFAYFAQRYGFEVVGTLLPSTTEGASPSAQDLAALVEAMRAAEVPAVFAENVLNNSLLDQAAREAGVQVVATLYTDALGPAGSAGGTYVGMMRSNVTAIVEALGG